MEVPLWTFGNIPPPPCRWLNSWSGMWIPTTMTPGAGGVITTGRCGYVPPMISPSPATGADSGRCACGACSSGSPRRSRPAAIIRRIWRSDYGRCSPGTARQMILRLREEYPRSDILTVGGCHLCEHCTRAGGPALPVSGGHRLYAGVFGLRRVRCGGAAAGLAASVEPEGMPAGVYGTGLWRADTVRDGLAMIAAEGKNKVRKRLVSGL